MDKGAIALGHLEREGRPQGINRWGRSHSLLYASRNRIDRLLKLMLRRTEPNWNPHVGGTPNLENIAKVGL